MRCSESDRAVICPASLVLPRTRVPNAKRDAAAAWGTDCHGWVETGRTDNEAVEHKALLSGIRREDWWPAGGRHEVTFAIHLPTRVVHLYDEAVQLAVDSNISRDGWKAAFIGPEWLTGTIDYLGTRKGRPWVDDLKTGRWPVDPRKSRQLRSYALLPWILEGCPIDALYYRSITHWPRYPLAELPTRTGLEHPLTGLDLMTHLDDLRWSVEHPDEANPTEDGCRFCESKNDCDAYQTERLKETA